MDSAISPILFVIREAIAKLQNRRKKDQKTQQNSSIRSFLRSLCFFAASSAIGSRVSDFFRPSAFGLRISSR
jgi:hypothetical protein